MPGTVLQRILSRTKIISMNNDKSANGQNSVQQQQQSSDMSQNSALAKVGGEWTKSRITFDPTTTTTIESKRSSLHEIDVNSMYNSRKHSYASVREDSDLPQSFRTRKASNESDTSIDRPYRKSEYTNASSKLSALRYGYKNTYDDESALFDDDDSSNVSPRHLSRADSYVSDFELEKPVTTIESLPDEILDLIFNMIQIENSADPYMNPRSHLFSCLLVSKAVHAAALRVLYKHVSIYRSKTFRKFVTSLEEDSELGKLVQVLDFSHYSQMGYGKSRGQTNVTPYLTKETLGITLSSTSSLKAFLVHEHIDDELDSAVLSKLFSIKTLQAVDFTSCMSETFVTSFSGIWTNPLFDGLSQLKRLCLHECTTLKPEVFENLLPRLGQVTHLDLAHTRVNDKALMSIPHTAQITHLNLERCTQITGDAVVRFLTEHPAARDTMVWLNLNADASRYRLLSDSELDDLLPVLPPSLKSLNIGGAKIGPQHVSTLRYLASQLEELGLKGANLSLGKDITQILSLPADNETELDHPEIKSSLRYIDLTDIKSVTQMSLLYSPISIKTTETLPLEVIELGSAVLTEIARRNKNVKLPDWTVKELGRRGWYVRSPDRLPAGHKPDDGYRSWKMGARWWGMRKLPMIEQDVGGMYGYFMFKRN